MTLSYGRQLIDEADVAAVVAALTSDRLTQGPAVEEFEAALAERVGARHCVVLANGTAALHAAAAAAGLGPGDRVAVSALTFVASINAVRYVGANPVLVDTDPRTLNLDIDSVPAPIDGLIAVHYAGLPARLDRLARRPRVVIEDASHALGALTPDGPVGNCARSDMTTFSFHPVKPITAAEGGAVSTNDDELAERLRRFRTHGVERRGRWDYDVSGLGFNYRLSDLHAALGRSQLTKLDGFLARRDELVARYRRLLAGSPVILPPEAPLGYRHARHLFPIRVRNRNALLERLAAHDIAAQVHYPSPSRFSFWPEERPLVPRTDVLAAELVSLPLHPAMEDADVDRVVELVEAHQDSTPTPVR